MCHHLPAPVAALIWDNTGPSADPDGGGTAPPPAESPLAAPVADGGSVVPLS
jgi:hypothetical protein